MKPSTPVYDVAELRYLIFERVTVGAYYIQVIVWLLRRPVAEGTAEKLAKVRQVC
jgi:hypothetical protein